jgi:methyltransferase-like protein
MFCSEDFIERISNAVYNYEPYKNDNNIRLGLKYKFILEDLKENFNKGFSVTDTDYCTRNAKGTLEELVESIINKHGFETMMLDFTLTHKKHIIFMNSLRKFLTKQLKNNPLIKVF